VAKERSYLAHVKVIMAAMKLFGERGIDATSMDAIARESKVSKATIYSHWANKEALLTEVMLFVNGLDREQEVVDSGDQLANLVQDLAAVLSRKPPKELEETRRRLMPNLIAYSATHPVFGAAWRHRVMEPPRQSLKVILLKGIERGLLPWNLDIELSMALLLGPMLYRHIFNKSGSEPEYIGPETAEAFCRAFAIQK
jgi:AcrR family transcriptional regulator